MPAVPIEVAPRCGGTCGSSAGSWPWDWTCRRAGPIEIAASAVELLCGRPREALPTRVRRHLYIHSCRPGVPAGTKEERRVEYGTRCHDETELREVERGVALGTTALEALRAPRTHRNDVDLHL
ncbi:hypothetical protein NDU88_004781 [Pleurodeles waltl]|uniref:Uncharacterized protein n=1 Tax=Pleurodeles waltl TaxID=8319 RepID=A0AAV7L9M2_PLEWA|nr:hypothetical protein NDU88_004781 [Pleurodeles waltl]